MLFNVDRIQCKTELSRIAYRLAFAAMVAVALAITVTSSAQAKDLTNRLGVGYANQFSTNVPSLAVRYYPEKHLALGAELGVDTEQGNSQFGFQVNVHRIVFTEPNLNFYMGSSVGLISTQANASTTQSGFELSAFVGTEFFLAGLPNLGFSMEAGVGVTSISSQVRVRTIADSPLQAGMIFYF